MNCIDSCCKSSVGIKMKHKWTRPTSLVLKSFINNLFIMKSRDLSYDCLIGSTSRPYKKIGIHFTDTSWRITSSDAICPIFPKILLNARWKPRFAASREHLTVRNLTRYTPRYRISEVHGIEWPIELVIVAQTTSLRGPIRKHEDLLKLIVMSSHASSTSHLCKRCCKWVTDDDKSNMSSAYKIIWPPFTDDSNLLRSSRYTANKKGDLPYTKIDIQTLFHLT